MLSPSALEDSFGKNQRYIIIELPTFTESGRFVILLAGNPYDNPVFHFYLKEDSE
jgi:hypothetical protein